jgi:methylenetetrahydrofolate reductase (NADPH)
MMATAPFEVICEIQPSTRPDLMLVRHQIGVLSRIASAFLIPDNHLGRATISSVAVAHEVDLMGGRSIACLNARDRNLLGFRRDLMTAAAYGVDEFLFVFGDRPSIGTRTGELTVRSMLDELRRFSEAGHEIGSVPLRAGVTARLQDLPDWKRHADFVFVQACFEIAALLRWREATGFEGKVFAGVLVPPSASRARKWATEMPEISVPDSWIAALDSDPSAGIELSCELAIAIRDSGAFDGLHLIPGVRHREVALRLESQFGR